MLADYRNVIKNIVLQMNKKGITENNLSDLLDICATHFNDNPNDADMIFKYTKIIKKRAIELHKKTQNEEFGNIFWRTCLFEAPYKFESFMLYMEKNRPPEERFYQPRMNPLRLVAQGIQDLADDKLDELFINMPSRVGKTQIVKFGYLWFGSRNSELSNLYTAYSDKITNAFYTGLIELITDPTYTYKEIFPDNLTNGGICATNAKDETIDLVRKKTYPSFTCRSIYGTLNGACDCNGLAVADDLFSGIAEAISIDRQETVWGVFDNNFKKRLKKKAKLINMGTRWAVKDVQGRRLDLLMNRPEYKNRRWRAIVIPALNEKDESNFDYPYNLGYSTEDYRMDRASFEENDDMASWYAQAQQEPIERQGTLFKQDNLNYFKPEDLPEGEPDRVYSAVDIAFGGGDYVSAPICYQYGDTGFIVDVVFNAGDKYITRPLIVEKALKHRINAIQFEETKTTADYRQWCEEEWKKVDFKINSYGKAAPNNTSKNARIFDKAPEIREYYFLDYPYQDKEYKDFMKNILAFKIEGKVKHDDAPDSMAQLCDAKIGKRSGSSVYAVRNPFRRYG